MQKIERQVLFKEKVSSGKTERQAVNEIELDEEYCKLSKKVNKIKIKKEKDMEKIKEESNKRFQKEFKKLTKFDIEDGRTKNKFINHYSTRILNRLKESPTTQKKLSEDCCLSFKRTTQVLAILIKLNLIRIKEIKERGTIYEIA